jgi:hypothetical protein
MHATISQTLTKTLSSAVTAELLVNFDAIFLLVARKLTSSSAVTADESVLVKVCDIVACISNILHGRSFLFARFLPLVAKCAFLQHISMCSWSKGVDALASRVLDLVAQASSYSCKFGRDFRRARVHVPVLFLHGFT